MMRQRRNITGQAIKKILGKGAGCDCVILCTMKRLLWALLVFVWHTPDLLGQGCTIQTSTDVVCLGNTVSFSVQPGNPRPVAGYRWRFGNGVINTQASPVYQYTASGTYTPAVTVYYQDGDSCTSTGQPLQVFALPSTQFSFTTVTSQCFNWNEICLKDLSVSGSSNAPLDSGNLYWDDGTKVYFSPLYGKEYCHRFQDGIGGVYQPVIEIVDTNGCISRLKRDTITIFPQPPLDFVTNYTVSCPQTPVKIKNNSTKTRPRITHFAWDLGDGSLDSVHWDSLVHVYTSNGKFAITLLTNDINGCRDTLRFDSAVANLTPDPKIYLDPGDHSCFRNNAFNYLSNNPLARVSWAFYMEPGVLLDTFPEPVYPQVYQFPTCGLYSIRMYVNYVGTSCKLYADTLIDVYGPNAVIQTGDNRIVNQAQCQIHDTVFFRTPVPYLHCHYKNTVMDRLWDFGDGFAPPCTTDTRNGIHVNENCRWSKDSMNVWHYYTPGHESCYKVTIYMEDTVKKCWDKDSAMMRLSKASAHWDSTSNPIRRGVYFKGKGCLHENIYFFFDELLPECGPDSVWLLPDSACGMNSWVQLTAKDSVYTHQYHQTCDSSGWVTYGVVVHNGKDASGQTCYDTAWYHRKLFIQPIDPQFTFRIKDACTPRTVELIPSDTAQDSIDYVVWRIQVFADTFSYPLVSRLFDTLIVRDVNGPYLSREYFTTSLSGVMMATLRVVNTQGCALDYSRFIAIGTHRDFVPERLIRCVGDSVTLIDTVSYCSSRYPYWSDPLRAAAGKETLSWDLGDGKGFTLSGHNPRVVYTVPGLYTIRLVVKDSMGCRDTVVHKDILDVVQVRARIGPLADSFYCAPFFLDLKDSSKIAGFSDAISEWVWTFSDQKPRSILQFPQHEFTSNGPSSIYLTVKTNAGCTDTTSRSIFIKGPQPRFDILTDTIGCTPLLTILKNTTGYQLHDWRWDFHDPSNTAYFTERDTNVSFNYTVPGTYEIRLFGHDTIRDPATGTSKHCYAYFPDTITHLPKRVVRVVPRATLQLIGPDSICANEPDTFIARGIPVFPSFQWNLGDGNQLVKSFPDTILPYLYTKSGTYAITLAPLATDPKSCIDTARKTLVVEEVYADFEIDESELPLYHFNNKSRAAYYRWYVGDELNNPFSGAVNPSREFTDTGAVLICLQAFNEQGCWDTTCRSISAKVRLIIPNVFTPDNRDGKNDAFDIDIVGWTKYELLIYNRWGTPVFESTQDGVGNDGINWNGREYNTGAECSEGVYFYVFKYAMINERKDRTLHGTITLIRPDH